MIWVSIDWGKPYPATSQASTDKPCFGIWCKLGCNISGSFFSSHPGEPEVANWYNQWQPPLSVSSAKISSLHCMSMFVSLALSQHSWQPLAQAMSGGRICVPDWHMPSACRHTWCGQGKRRCPRRQFPTHAFPPYRHTFNSLFFPLLAAVQLMWNINVTFFYFPDLLSFCRFGTYMS